MNAAGGVYDIQSGVIDFNNGSVGFDNAGILSGAGTIDMPVVVRDGGTLAPGFSPGTINTDSLDLQSGSTLEVDLGGSAANPGTDFDRINVTGTVTLGGDLDLVPFSSISPGENYVIIANDGSDAVVGTFDGIAQGSTVVTSFGTFLISYTGGTGNDVTLISLSETHVVTTSVDVATGSLREALVVATAGDFVAFNIPGPGPHQIELSAPLPAIDRTVFIDATSEPGFESTPLIEITPASGAPVMDGLQFVAGSENSVVRGLSVTGFTGPNRAAVLVDADNVTVEDNWIGVDPFGNANGSTDGIRSSAANTTIQRNVVSGNLENGVRITSSAATGNVVTGNLIGTNVSGTAALANGAHGVLIEAGASGTVVGGVAVADRNIISGNGLDGIFVTGAATDNTTIHGNFIGTNASGTAALSNRRGITAELGTTSVQIGGAVGSSFDDGPGNVISGNLTTGISLNQAGADATVQGNRIGTNVAGTLPLGNGTGGIDVVTAAGFAAVIGTDGDGTTDETEGNVISGNAGPGVRLAGIGGAGGNTVAGNMIGVDVAGTQRLANAGDGVLVLTNANIIGSDLNGTSDELESNIIGANTGAGVMIVDAAIGDGNSVDGNRVAGKVIGTDRNATSNLSNAGSGIAVLFAANSEIGGSAAFAGNTIAFNGGNGLSISGSSETGPTAEATTNVRSNLFFENDGLAIDLSSNSSSSNGPGVTLNDPNDGVLDFALIETATIDGTDLTVTGFALPGSEIEFYTASPEAGANNERGEGRLLLGSFTEGSAADALAGTGTYGPVLAGVAVSVAPITTNRFSFTLPLPDDVSHGALLTALTLGSVSEFSPSVLAGEQGSSLAPEISIGEDIVLQQGERLERLASFEDLDSTSWTASVDYGDGSPIEQIAFSEDRSFDLDHVFVASGTHEVVVTVTDNTFVTATSSFTVTVNNDAPEGQFNQFSLSGPVTEGDVVTLSGSFDDGGTNDVHIIEIDWGDGSPIDSITVPVGARNFTATHVYPDDANVGGTVTPVALYRVSVTVSDGTGNDSSPLGLYLAEVQNAAPSNLSTTFSSTSLIEGDTLILDGVFDDPGILDTHDVTIDWGDGSVETLSLPANVTDFSNITHDYAADGEFTVIVSVVDDDEPLSPLTATQVVTVGNSAPSNVVATLDSTSIDEDGSVLLDLTFTDSGIGDRHRLTIDWGDGSSPTDFVIPARARAVSGIAHQYLDDPAAGTTFEIGVTIREVDDAASSGTGSATVTVNNLDPSVTNIQLTPSGALNEGDEVTVTGEIVDVGSLDRHTVLVNFGDGLPPVPAEVNSDAGTFSLTHTLPDNSLTGSADIVVTITDDDGGSSTTSLDQNIANVAPEVSFTPDESNSAASSITLHAVIDFDPGAADTFTHTWTAFVPTDGAVAFVTASGPSFALDLSAAPTAVWIVELTTTDDDGGVGTFEAGLRVGTSAADNLIVTDATFAPGSETIENLVILGLGDADVLDASGVVNSANNVILDGGSGNDTLYGGSGDDITFLRNGDDSANVGGAITPNVAGNDRYFVVPNSTQTVFDNLDANAIDFSLADFGSDDGIAFDLSLNTLDSMTAQDVGTLTDDPANTHVVQTQGVFNELVGSDFDDQLTAGLGSTTLLGGTGADEFNVKANTVSANISGGVDADTLTSDGVNIGSLNFSGDDGFDVLTNTGSIGTLTFGGGADGDELLNTGSIGDLSFGGGADGDALINSGSISDLTFGGGADGDALTNTGSITELTFGGGADGDALTNNGGNITLLNFNGDDGFDELTNTGSIGTLTFGGGADGDELINTGSVGSLSFGGGADGDALLNDVGGSIGTLTFGGGADGDALVNNGEILTTLSFNGDDGFDLLTNNGSIAELDFGGGADGDGLLNTGSIGTLTFGGGADGDELVNNGGSITTLSFNGDDGFDALTNEGSIGTLTFGGGADGDALTNNIGNITTLNFNGDDGFDTLVNNATIGTLTFGGGADGDGLLNVGSIGDLTFGGGADGDALVNDGTGSITTLNFNGDDGFDALTNNGTITDLTFGGGADGDALLNVGSIESLTFGGGADGDALVNDGGSIATLNFNGDSGLDQLTNTGTITDLTFGGGADGDALVNDGGSIAELNFNGDDGLDSLTNTGTIGTLTFGGGADGDALVNDSSGTITLLNFNGDAGNDALLNNGSILALSFNGDTGADVLINNGDNVGSLTFGGGADGDTLINTGQRLGNLNFNGDADPTAVGYDPEVGGDDTIILRGSGTGTARVVIDGAGGVDAFQNNATGFRSIVFTGGGGNDVFQNNADATTDITFNGDTGDDVFEKQLALRHDRANPGPRGEGSPLIAPVPLPN